MYGKNDKIMEVKAVIFDWAGTTVDYGCMAPFKVFTEIFKNMEIDVSIKEARAPMGLLKKDHIKTMLEMQNIKNQWQKKYGRPPGIEDVEKLYCDFEPRLIEILPQYSQPIPGVVELVNNLRKNGIRIGSTTGYTTKMMETVAKESEKSGYLPDCTVASDEVSEGRPSPWMCYLNAMKLRVFPNYTIIKVGDTLNDIEEGINAGMWSIGVIKGGSNLGLSYNEVLNTEKRILTVKIKEIASVFKNAGAHFILEEISELEQIIKQINKKLGRKRSYTPY
jgi:phosphonoacetaldehyde hydrolase